MIISNRKSKTSIYSEALTRIVHEAKTHWTELEANPVAKRARGALVANGNLISAVLAFDAINNRIILTARLPFSKELNMPVLRQLLRYQNQHQNLSCFLSVDEETRIVSVWANVPVYGHQPALAVNCAFTDIVTMLNDSGLNDLLN